MKKLLFLSLIITSVSYGQTTLANKLKITNNTTSTTATKVNVQESDGQINTIAKTDLIDVLEYASAINLPVTGLSGKIYVTIDNRKLYRWNGTIYQELAVTDISSKENIANKQNSLAVDGSSVKYPTVDATNVGLALKRDITNFTFANDITVNGIRVGRGFGNFTSNTVFGLNGLNSNNLGTSIVSIGNSGLVSNTTGFGHVAIGTEALFSNTTGSISIAIGTQALFSNTTGDGSIAIGANSLNSNTTGSSSIGIGFQAGRYISDKVTPATIINSSVLIGSNTSPLGINQTNQIVIGNNANGLGSNTTVIGNSSTTTTRLFGRFLSGTSVDNGVDQIQTTGSILASSLKLSTQPAISDNTANFVTRNITTGVLERRLLSTVALIDSPNFTGIPAVPTATAGTNTTQIASTAFVLANTNANAVLLTGNQTILGTKNFYSEETNFGNQIKHHVSNNIANAISWQIKDLAPSQGAFKIGTSTVFLSMRESGPRYINVTDPIESPDPTALNHLTTKNYVDKNRMISYTVATLPASPTQGDSYMVTDATAPTYLGLLIGGGTVKCPVFFNGTNWVSH